jgi:hypothetical protein
MNRGEHRRKRNYTRLQTKGVVRARKIISVTPSGGISNSIVTRLRAERPGFDSRQGKGFSFSSLPRSDLRAVIARSV